MLQVLSSDKNAACESCAGAKRGDLLEIEYTGTLEDGKVFDGSSVLVGDACIRYSFGPIIEE